MLDTLSRSFDNKSAMSFADVVRGQEKHDLARSFSAILQLVIRTVFFVTFDYFCAQYMSACTQNVLVTKYVHKPFQMNNGNVDLQTSDTTEEEATCYTAEKPFLSNF